MKQVYIADYLRLPIGKQNGIYKNVIPENFTTLLVQELLRRNPSLQNFADSLILSTSVGTGGNMARYIGLAAGLSVQTPAYTIDAQCVGAYQALSVGINSIKSGDADVVIVGGFESNSLRPQRFYHENDERNGSKPYFYANFAPAHFGDITLPKIAEEVTIKYGFAKSELVDWAILSNERAIEAAAQKTLSSVICDFQDNVADQNIKSPKLLARFKHSAKLVDASTSCMLDDGAGIVVLASERGLDKLGTVPNFEIISNAVVGGEPKAAPEVFLAAIELCCKRADKKVNAIDLFEINESFAVKPLLFKKRYKISNDRINLLGGNLAYGHPFGASGVVNLMHLLQSIKVSGKGCGVVAASAAGGLGSAMMVQQL